jgi:hypothetical protein
MPYANFGEITFRALGCIEEALPRTLASKALPTEGGDFYRTFYALATQDFAGVAYELEALDLTVEGSVTWAGREAVR